MQQSASFVDATEPKNEAVIATSILNKFTTLGMPISKKVA
tara:strand:- start:353 stop:472 length:120 start_codon:yes stop_codon:yes gene_type:complete